MNYNGLNDRECLDLNYVSRIMPIRNGKEKSTDHGGDNAIVVDLESSNRQSFCDQTSQNEKDHGDHHDIRSDNDVGTMVKRCDFSMTGRHFALISLLRLAL